MDEYKYGDTPEQIQKCLACTRKRCNNCIEKSEEAKEQRRRRRELAIDRNKMMELHQQGKNDAEIAEAVGCCISTVYNWRIANGLQRNKHRMSNKHERF